MGVLGSIYKLITALCVVYLTSSARIKASNEQTFTTLFSVVNPTSINLVIAHPDDEVMFFAPTLLQLDQYFNAGIPVAVFSLTDGGADGLGSLREEELRDSVHLLFRRREAEVTVLDFEDGMAVNWDLEATVKVLSKHINDDQPLFLTFDDHGVSNHINHISCHETVRNLQAAYPKSRVFSLTSKRSIFQKYTAFVPSLISVFKGSTKPMFMNTFKQYLLAFSVMMNAHTTQMVWFRYGWWFFSYYVFANEIKEF
ncbi:LAQU0S03e02146g1_1 [Lachancea quebecensis]|uniref:N-acetylglucosaminylphosphatidylinositol deacetylase n=1 Tax=Lachancea quebecensis TaxID=1654605 RepID=A0A0P1KNL7_9SACH|nr:LAQU0S03e02146g1_1 [Lachancea quebecensis]